MNEPYAIVGATIFNGYSFFKEKAVVIKGQTILDVCDVKEVADLPKKNFAGLTLCAGFIDLQINGCGGVLYNDNISEVTLQKMHETNLKYGTTSFLPTLITTSEDNIKKAVYVAKEHHQKYKNSVIGIHIEGPYISKEKKGAHNLAYIKPINEEMVDFLCEQNKHIPIKITIAPEVNNLNLIRKLALNGVKVSMGHTNATYEEAMAGIGAGVSMCTHLFNAMSAMEGRNPNAVGAILNSSIYAGIIVDGHHVNYHTIELVKKIKQDKLYIVTDAVTPMGSDIKEFYLADQKVFVKNGACINESGVLAGANIDMLSSIKNAVDFSSISLAEVLKMASLYPAEAMGQNFKLGKIHKGFVANLVAFDNNYKTHFTVDNGVVHKIAI